MIALIHSPFQAYSLYCYLQQEECADQVTVVIRSDDIHKELTSLKSIFKILEGLNVRFLVIENRRKFFTVCNAILLINKAKSILIGDLTNKLNVFLLRFLLFKKRITLLEDGTSLHVDYDEISRGMKRLKIKDIYSISVINPKLYPAAKIHFGRLAFLNLSEQRCLESFIQKDYLLLGSPLIDHGVMLKEDYLSLIDRVFSRHFLSKDFWTYVRHRREDKGILKTLSRFSAANMVIKNFPLGFDITLMASSERLDLSRTHLIAFPSTALLTLAEAGILRKFQSVTIIDLSREKLVGHHTRTMDINKLCIERCINIGIRNVIY